MRIRFQFQPEVAVQVAAYFLRKSGGRMDKVKLMKLMYLADRDHFLENGYPITGDNQSAMPHGPVPSCTLNLLSGVWSDSDSAAEFISCEPKSYAIARDPGDTHLTPTNMAILDQVFQTHGHKHTWKLRDETHKLPEFRECEVTGSSGPIPYEVILKHHGGTKKFRHGRAVISTEMAAHMECPFAYSEPDL